jgi:hypothetical protein
LRFSVRTSVLFRIGSQIYQLGTLFLLFMLRYPLYQGFSTGVPRDVARVSGRALPTLLTYIRVDVLCGEGEPHKKSTLISWPK